MINFIIGLLIIINNNKIYYNTILKIVDYYSKIIKYISYNKEINLSKLIKVLWNEVFSIFELLNKIVFNKEIVFINCFWSVLYFYLKYK